MGNDKLFRNFWKVLITRSFSCWLRMVKLMGSTLMMESCFINFPPSILSMDRYSFILVSLMVHFFHRCHSSQFLIAIGIWVNMKIMPMAQGMRERVILTANGNGGLNSKANARGRKIIAYKSWLKVSPKIIFS